MIVPPEAVDVLGGRALGMIVPLEAVDVLGSRAL
jgi:hypothetical protein